ncbi:TetR/AcrR family transcriptional regulator [Sorangium sp. So ce281]|uniref:TetR/AcrR family transcriptional regulator n=1 Tax=unclassified Sorangium TaxID=2621164 RepID=UPI003F6461C9
MCKIKFLSRSIIRSMGELRESKKRETRQRISDVATAMFFARGFDAVTVEEIAAAANVSKMTVFNYFARKEDLFLDREDEVKLLLREAIRGRPQGQPPIDALRRLVDRLCEQKHPFARIDGQTVGWWRVVAASPSLKARLREIGDEVVEGLAVELAGPTPDGLARLVAGMVVLTWRTAYGEAIRVFERGGSAKKANAAFIALIDRGFAALLGMAAGSSWQTTG